MEFESVIGLEVHVQLSTRTKLFCGCSASFGGEPNTHVCAVCLGYPGALPVLNREALRFGVRAGLAFGCTIAEFTKFDRKNYFYPDLPKGYQISQFDRPYAEGGEVVFDLEDGSERRISLTRIHLEEDAGKSIHAEGHDGTWIDLNRCGTPLLEMVSEPEIRSGAEAARYLRTVRDIMRWIGVSDVNMEEGSLRCDVNISLRPVGASEFGTRAEIKNLNSFQNVEKAIEVEEVRQAEILRGGGVVVQETRLFDADRGVTESMRGKEEAHDYRYFPEPDLTPVTVARTLIEEEGDRIPELPRARRQRYRDAHALAPTEIDAITATRAHADYFDGVVEAGASAKEAANWIQTEVQRDLNERKIAMEAFSLGAAELARIIEAVGEERISVATGREVFREAVSGGESVESLLASRGEQVSDAGALEGWVQEVLDANPDAVEKIRGGDGKPVAFLMGQVMKLSRGQANPRKVSELIQRRIAE